MGTSYQIPVIWTERLVIRPFSFSDAPTVQCLAGAPEVADTTLMIPHPYEDGMAETWISTHRADAHGGKAYHWAVTRRSDRDLIGAISLSNVQRPGGVAEIGYWIGVPYWGRGFATEAARGVIEWGFQRAGLHRIHAVHFARNPASGAVLRKAGMHHEGTRPGHIFKNGRWEDLELYGILVNSSSESTRPESPAD